MMHPLWIDSRSVITHCDSNTVVIETSGRDQQCSLSIFNAEHRLDRIDDQIQHNLLQLNAVTRYFWEIVCQYDTQVDAVLNHLSLSQGYDFIDELVYLEERL